MPQYFSLVTLNGQAKVADAIANVSAVNITHLAVGDGNGAPVTPLETQTALVHEVWRGAVTSVTRDPAHPTQVIVQALIPIAAGPFVIREMALIASDGSLFAVQNTAELEKTIAAQGATQDVLVYFRVVVATTAQITVTVDPAQLVTVAGLLRAPFIAIDSFLSNPPANPVAGQLHVVTAGAGAFAGLNNQFVQWNGVIWVSAVAPQRTVIGCIADGLFYQRTAAGWALWHASEAERGLSKLATIAQCLAGTDTANAVTPAGLRAAMYQLNKVTFATPGTTTWVVPAGVNVIYPQLWGGAGSGALYSTSTGKAVSGGSAGTYNDGPIAVTPGETLTIEVGAGGAATTQNANGNAGGATRLKRGAEILLEAPGGPGGLYAAASVVNSPGFGTLPTLGLVKRQGGAGGVGISGQPGGKGGDAYLGGAGTPGAVGGTATGLAPGGGGGAGAGGGAGGRGELVINY